MNTTKLQRESHYGDNGNHVLKTEETETPPPMTRNLEGPSNVPSHKGHYHRNETKERKKHIQKQDIERNEIVGTNSQTGLDDDALVMPGAVAISGFLTNERSNSSRIDSFRRQEQSEVEYSMPEVEDELQEDTSNMLVEAKLVSDDLECIEADIRNRIQKEQLEKVVQAEIINENQNKQNDHHNKPNISCCYGQQQLGKCSRILGALALFIVIGVAIVLARVIPANAHSSNPVANPSNPVDPDVYNSDIWLPNITESMWPTTGQPGLKLEVINELDEKWQSIFATAIQNWDEGYPIDPLTLSITRIENQFNCSSSSVEGKVLVCNADFGFTDWVSITILMTDVSTNLIVAATVKMNDYYLNYAEESFKLYYMCHSLGQAFGLTYADDDWYNKDLGNCMDVTQNEADNETPDESNFLALGKLYGGVDVESGENVTAQEVQNYSSW